jgi:hypothetical protein
MLTAATGLISAVTGLVIAVQQLRPSHAATTATPVTQPRTESTVRTDSGRKTRAPVRAARVRVGFPEGRHVTINDLGYDVVSTQVSTKNPGQIELALQVRMTNSGRYPANFWNQTFRLRIGPDTKPPTSFLDDLVAAGTTKSGEVDFTLPRSTQSGTLLVGDDPAQAIGLRFNFSGR